ncbi:hypothetical protein [Zhenpiania hominis]|uniref:hypothetical protein n=1 Tax=Zhenpiania hominis TaxID=2763644 RepID=UPI0039F62180
MDNRVKKTIRLGPSLAKQLETYAKEEDVTETFVFEQALKQYFQNQREEYDRIAERFLELYEAKYKNYMTRVRLAAREADVNSQILLELANSMLFLNSAEGKDFIASDEMEHPMMQNAKHFVKDRIARFKQKNDSRRHE